MVARNPPGSSAMRIALLVFSFACASASASSSGNKARYDGIASAIARGDAPKTTSILVMRGGAVEYQQYFGEATPETLHDTRSATKSLTALAVGIALGRQLLPGLEAPA